MSNVFREIIFPAKSKEEVVSTLYWKVVDVINTANIDYKNMTIFDTIWCVPKRSWVSLSECVDCGIATKTIQEILEDDVGCD